MEQAAALLAGGRFHEALALYAQSLRQQPESLTARIGLARACLGTGDALTAIAWASKRPPRCTARGGAGQARMDFAGPPCGLALAAGPRRFALVSHRARLFRRGFGEDRVAQVTRSREAFDAWLAA